MAADQVFVPSASTSVTFEIPYTAGTVKGQALSVTGALSLDAKNKLVRGRFTVPLDSMKTANETRDCHMREALGIDYTHSQFPGAHVCNAQNQTPPTGPDSIVFPNLEFEFSDLLLSTGEALPVPLESKTMYAVQLQGRFFAHGKEARVTFAGTLLQEGGQLRLQSTFPITLKDHGIIVKPSQAGPVLIKVGEKATVKLDLLLAPNQD